MRRMIGWLALTMITTAFVFTGMPTAAACSCMPVEIEDAINEHTAAAFVGTAVASQDVGYPEEGHGNAWHEPVRWTFEVETMLHGDVPALVEVGSGYGGGDCGVDFSNRGRVGIVAYEDDLGWSTGTCGGVWNADALIAAHGPGQTPTPVDGASLPGWVWAVAAGAILLAGAVAAAMPKRES